MKLKQTDFARLCGVKPPSISELIKRGIINAVERKIDIDDASNLSYLVKHNITAAEEYRKTGSLTGIDQPMAIPSIITRKSMAKNLAMVKAEERQSDTEEFNPLTPPRPRRPQSTPINDDVDNTTAGMTGAEIAETMRKPLYDARKAKLAAEREAVNLDILHESLGERAVFEAFILELWQSMQRNYIDVAPKQAALVCKRLGCVGKELDVIEVLEGDIKKRQENVAHEVKTILSGRLTQKIIDDEVEE